MRPASRCGRGRVTTGEAHRQPEKEGLMTRSSTVRRLLAACLALVLTAAVAPVLAQEEGSEKGRMELYGFAMLDMGYEKNQSDPDWFDVLRPTKLPWFEDQFGHDGHFFAGVRQSRFGVKGW